MLYFKAVFVAFFSLCASVHARECSYDCDAPHGSMFGLTNLNAGASGMPAPDSVAFSPVVYQQICSSSTTSIGPLLQPQVGYYQKNQFYIVCPGPEVNSRFLSLFKSDTKNIDNFETIDSSVLELVKTADITASGKIISFLVGKGYVAVLTTNAIQFFDAATLELLWSLSNDSFQFSGLPAMSFTHVFVTFGNTIIKVPFDYIEGSGNFEVINAGYANKLDYMVIDSNDAIYFCTTSGLVKTTSSSSKLFNLINLGESCDALILPASNKVMYASGSKVFELRTTSITSANNDLGEVITEVSGSIKAMTRVAYTLNNKPVSLMSLTTNKGIVIVADKIDDVERGKVLHQIGIKAEEIIALPAAMTTTGDPAFATKGVISALEADEAFVFYDLGRVLGVTDYSFATFPVMLSNTGFAAITTDGKVVLYSYCRRYEVGDDLPEKRACPIADFPDSNGLNTALIVIASASALLALPTMHYLYRKGKFSTDRKHETEKNHRVALPVK